MVPPFSSMIRASASGKRIDPPSGRIQLKRWRPATREKASVPVSGSSSGCSVMNAIQPKKARTCSSWNRAVITSRALA